MLTCPVNLSTYKFFKTKLKKNQQLWSHKEKIAKLALFKLL